jgi:hypothetical protein
MPWTCPICRLPLLEGGTYPWVRVLIPMQRWDWARWRWQWVLEEWTLAAHHGCERAFTDALPDGT